MLDDDVRIVLNVTNTTSTSMLAQSGVTSYIHLYISCTWEGTQGNVKLNFYVHMYFFF